MAAKTRAETNDFIAASRVCSCEDNGGEKALERERLHSCFQGVFLRGQRRREGVREREREREREPEGGGGGGWRMVTG